MENAEEVFHFLEEFSKRKPITIPQELNDYLAYVARTGDPVYQWSLVKSLFKEKLLNVITDFYETTPGIDIPPYPNVDPFNYDIMKNSLIEKLDSFTSAPFTVQRICELLTCPRKQYNRVDKFMRAVEKNILVVSTREPGIQRHVEPENGEPIVNGSDNNSEYNVDVEMEDVSWKENSDHQNTEPQPSSSETPVPADTLLISVDNSESSVQVKQSTPMDTQEKTITQYPTVTPLEHNLTGNSTPQAIEDKSIESLASDAVQPIEKSDEMLKTNTTASLVLKEDVEMKSDGSASVLVIPEIKVDESEMTEQKLDIQPDTPVVSSKEISTSEKDCVETKSTVDPPQALSEDSCSSSVSKDDVVDSKIISEVSTSSEESSSSSDNTDGYSNSPKTDPESHTDILIEAIVTDNNKDETSMKDIKEPEPSNEASSSNAIEDNPPQVIIQTDNYSISDVNSELQQIPLDTCSKPEEETKEDAVVDEKTETKPSKESEEKQSTIKTSEQQD